MGAKKNNVIQIENPQNKECFPNEWMTRRQASSYLQIGISTLDTRIPVKKYFLGKSVRYNKTDLDDYLRANCKEPKIGGTNNV